MKIPAQSKAADLLDKTLDWTVAPGYSKVGLEVRERIWGRTVLDLEGKVAIVTGATSGIGEAACVGLARGGAEVHLVVRNLEKGEEARARVASASGVDGDSLALHRCDLSSLASVRSFSSAFLRAHPRLDVLVNNAGVLPPERTHTDEGFELTFATNVLGPFLLTARLLPALRAAAPARVIGVSSGGMYAAKLDVDDPQLEGREFSGNRFYAHTKRAELVLGDEWARRLAPEVQVFSMHPGWVATPGLAESLPGFDKLMRPLLRDAAGGADTIVWLAGSPEVRGQTGGFWHDRRRRPEHRLPSTRESAAERERFFAECERLAGVEGIGDDASDAEPGPTTT